MPIQDKGQNVLFKGKGQNVLFKGNYPAKYVTPKMLSYLSEESYGIVCLYSLLSFDMQCSLPEHFQMSRSARGHAHPHSDIN